MNVLVTGGAGYIGSVIVDRLLQEGHAVVVYDNLSRGHADNVPQDVDFVVADLRDESQIRATLARHRVDAVVHMAAYALVGESMADPAMYYENNVVGSLCLLNAMARVGVQQLVFSSTAATYGAPVKQPIFEEDPTNPTNPYGQSKLAVEHALRWYYEAYRLRFVALRYFNAAGATPRRRERHDPETHLIPLVLRAARDPHAFVSVYGNDYQTRDGTCVRDYVHVSDLADAHVLALEGLRMRAIATACLNVGSGGSGYTVLEVVDAARRVTGRDVNVQMETRRLGDPCTLIANCDRIKKTLGWKPKLNTLDDIIRSAWEAS